MKELYESLETNTEAIKRLENRYSDTITSNYYKFFKTEKERLDELLWISKIKKRVLRMRYRILENINAYTIKEMQKTSNRTKDLKAA